MLKNINNFLNKPLNTSDAKHGTGVIKRTLKNKYGDTYYIVSIDIGNGHSVEAKSTEYAKTSPVLDVGTTCDISYFQVGKNVYCEIKDNMLITAKDARNKKSIYFVCVGVMAVILFTIFLGAKSIF